jgi:hypothetical protein
MYHLGLSGIYILEHTPTGMCYVGESIDVFSRWSSHYTQLKIGRHSSKLFQELWGKTRPEEWSWRLLEVISKTESKERSGLKGRSFETFFKRELRSREKHWMGLCSKGYALNQNQKHFA